VWTAGNGIQVEAEVEVEIRIMIEEERIEIDDQGAEAMVEEIVVKIE
jgi:hypothetical protein